MASNGEGMPPSENPGGNGLSKDEKNWGMACHLLAFAGFIIPFGNIIGPLVVWLIKKDEMAFVDYNGKEAVNFQITVAICALVSFVLVFVFIGIPLLFALVIASIVFTIIAAVKAGNGEYYRYPFAIRFIS